MEKSGDGAGRPEESQADRSEKAALVMGGGGGACGRRGSGCGGDWEGGISGIGSRADDPLATARIKGSSKSAKCEGHCVYPYRAP